MADDREVMTISAGDVGALSLPDVPDFSDFGEQEYEPIAPIEPGWHNGTIVAYTDKKGNSYPTDTLSKKGDSRNLTLVVAIPDTTGRFRDGNRYVFLRGNYRPDLLTPAWLATINRKNFWESDPSEDEKAAFFSLRLIGSLQNTAKAAGRTFTQNGDGGYAVESLVDVPTDFNTKIETDRNGVYPPKAVLNRFGPFAPSGKHTAR